MSSTNITNEPSEEIQREQKMEGWLSKWVNYVKGYRKRWFVLTNGTLSYYRSRTEMAHTCRATVILCRATIQAEGNNGIVILSGSTKFHIRAKSEEEQKRWIMALELAKESALKNCQRSDYSPLDGAPVIDDKEKIASVVEDLRGHITDLEDSHGKLTKNIQNLQEALKTLQGERMSRDNADKIYTVAHFTGEVRRDAQSMRGPFRNCHEGLEAIQSETTKWQQLAQQKDQQCHLLDRTVEQLAKQQLHMEREAIKLHTGVSPESSIPSMEMGIISSSSDDETSFQDAVCQDSTCNCTLSDPSAHTHHTSDCKRMRCTSSSSREYKTTDDASTTGAPDEVQMSKSLEEDETLNEPITESPGPLSGLHESCDLELWKKENRQVTPSVSEASSKESETNNVWTGVNENAKRTRPDSVVAVTNSEIAEDISNDTLKTKERDLLNSLSVRIGDSKNHSSVPDISVLTADLNDITQKGYRSSADLKSIDNVGDNSYTNSINLSKSLGSGIDQIPIENGLGVIGIQKTCNEDKQEARNEDSCEEEQQQATLKAGSSSQLAGSGGRKRRTRVPDRPNSSLSLWSFMKNCIGQDLSKIPLPVNFNEPLSMLQRIVEDFEYSDILDHAEKKDQWEQMAYVAAFTVSSYATTSNRPTKPFNPLLGETYELDYRPEKGWRVISEQVSHHPPILALNCESNGWVCWQDLAVTSKFRGNYLNITPQGISHLLFQKSGNHYTWLKVTTTVHNIIVGRLWVDQSGEMTITNHKTGDTCTLEFIPYSYFSRDVQRKVQGSVVDAQGNTRWLIKGIWDEYMEVAPLSQPEKADKSGKLKSKVKQSSWKVVWRRKMPKPESINYYNFTKFACVLNEPEDGVAPTDSRLRPDQRLMEEGDWDTANTEKVRVEDKQRAARKQRETSIIPSNGTDESKPVVDYEPTWFKLKKDAVTNKMIYTYKGEYWKCKESQDWSRCPDIF